MNKGCMFCEAKFPPGTKADTCGHCHRLCDSIRAQAADEALERAAQVAGDFKNDRPFSEVGCTPENVQIAAAIRALKGTKP